MLPKQRLKKENDKLKWNKEKKKARDKEWVKKGKLKGWKWANEKQSKVEYVGEKQMLKMQINRKKKAEPG